jgi:hypothetical protein
MQPGFPIVMRLAALLLNDRRLSPQSYIHMLGVATRFVFNDTFLPDLSNFMVSSFFPVLAPRSGSRSPARHPISQVAVLS